MDRFEHLPNQHTNEKMMMKHLKLKTVFAVLFTLGTAQASFIPILSLDFGTGDAYNGSNTPAHDEGLLTGDTQFVKVGPTATTLTAAGSVDVAYASRRGGSAGSWNTGTNGGGLTTSVPVNHSSSDTGLFAGSLLTTTGLLSFNHATTARAPLGISLDLSGLARGDYHLFVVAHAGSWETAESMRVSYEFQTVGMGGGVSNTAAPVSQIATLSSSNRTTWQDGNNYIRFDFELTETTDDFLWIVSNSTDGLYNTTLSSVQLVAIPEPGALLLMGIALGSLLLFRRRK